jgi:hypothetical protein
MTTVGTLASRETLPQGNSKAKKCCLYQTLYVAAPQEYKVTSSQELHPMRNFLRVYIQEPDFFWFTIDFHDFFFWRDLSCQLQTPMYSVKESSERGTRNNYFTRLRSPAKRTFKCLIQDTPLWGGVVSTNLKKPKDQDDHKKGTLSNQPQLMHVTPTALLGSWEQQPIKDMTSLRTDFETCLRVCWGTHKTCLCGHASPWRWRPWCGPLQDEGSRCKGIFSKEDAHYHLRQSTRSLIEQDLVWRVLWESPRSCQRTSNNQPGFTSLEIPWGFLAQAVLCGLSGGLCHARKYKLKAHV